MTIQHLPLLLALIFAPVGAAHAQVDPRLPDYKSVQGVSGTVTSSGSDILNNLMTLWAEQFKEYYPSVQVEIEGKGSSSAPLALIAGTSTFGPMSRPMKDIEVKEFEKKFGYRPMAVKTAIDMVAVYVHKDNPVARLGLTLPEVDAIFSSTRNGGYPRDITTWGQTGLSGAWASFPISIYGRSSASGTYSFFQQNALFKGKYKDSVKEQPASSSVVQGIASDRNGIGFGGLGYQTSDVAAVPIARAEGEKPVPASVDSAVSYPLARFLLLYVDKRPGRDLDPLRREFLKLIFSKQGQEVVVEDGYIPVSYEIAKATLAEVGIDIGSGQVFAQPDPFSPMATKLEYGEVEVFYSTDRAPTGSSKPASFYGYKRGDFALGVCRVSIPRDHRMGALEGPLDLWVWKANPIQRNMFP